MDRKGIFVLLGIIVLLTGCGNHAAVTTEMATSNTVGENTESSTDAGMENEKDASAIEIPEVLPENTAVYKGKSTYYENGEASVIWVSSYDAWDNVLLQEKVDPVSGESMFSGKRAYIYNQEGQIRVAFQETVDDYDTYQYNEDGTVSTHCRYTDGELKEKNEYVYDEHGNEINATRYLPDREESLVSEQKTGYRYDDKGNMMEAISYDAEGQIDFRCCYEYNEKNQVIKSYILRGDSTEYLAYFAYTYDDNGNMLREDVYGRENTSDAFVISSSRVYAYDAKNRRIKEEKYEADVLQEYTITEYEDIN